MAKKQRSSAAVPCLFGCGAAQSSMRSLGVIRWKREWELPMTSVP